jgi:hypothetical protein
VPVRIRGGASHLRFRRPAGIPVRLRVGHGVTDLRFDQQQWARSAVGCGRPPPGGHPGPDRYEIEIASGAAHLEISAEGGGNRSRPTIQAVGLRKRFGKTTALDELDLILSSGQVLAVLGATTNHDLGRTQDVHTPAARHAPRAGRNQHTVERQGG